MNGRISRYLAKNVFSALMMVTLILMALQVFILLVNQIDDIGRGTYTVSKAFLYAILMLPEQIYGFSPMAFLLGSLVGLGLMAHHRELLVMRASGISILQIVKILSWVALGMLLLFMLIGEGIAPISSYSANTLKLDAISNGQMARTQTGLWLKYDHDMVNIGVIEDETHLSDVTQFHLNDEGHLLWIRSIAKVLNREGTWYSFDVREAYILTDKITEKRYQEAIWDIQPKHLMLSGGGIAPDEMSLPVLYDYVKTLKENNQPSGQASLNFWQRIMQPLSSWVMLLLGVPFVFGPLRSSTMSARLLLGAMVGFSVHWMDKLSGSLVSVFQWPPWFVALAPILLFGCIGFWMIKRVQ